MPRPETPQPLTLRLVAGVAKVRPATEYKVFAFTSSMADDLPLYLLGIKLS